MEVNYYLQSDTAIEIWNRDDAEGQGKMISGLTNFYKKSFFDQVIYKSNTVPEYRLTELAENAFLSSWEIFNKKGRAGEIAFKSSEYSGFFYIIFKRAYLKLLANEIKIVVAEKEYGKQQALEINMPITDRDLFSFTTQSALNKISSDCRELLIWKHVDGLSHDEIAVRKNIKRNSSIKMISRCGKRFMKHWQHHSNNT